MKQLKTICLSLLLSASLTACAGRTEPKESPANEDGIAEETVKTEEKTETAEEKKEISKETIEIRETLESSADGEHVITSDGESKTVSNTAVNKTGDSEGDEADFYGENAAVFAENGASLDLSQMVITTAGTHANAVFSYGEGTVVTIRDSVIETSGSCSGGIMTTGGGTMHAENLSIHTTGNSSAAIRSDRGGGTVVVTGGSYITDGKGSPAIYSTADITVNDADLISTASQGVVVEGKNSVTLNNVNLTANNNTKNSDKSDYYQAVMIYQSMSGDAAVGTSSFTMNGGTLTNKNGDIFFVNNTVTEIALSHAVIVNQDENGVFLRAAAAGWGKEGSNGGQVTMNASAQEITGNILVDSVSAANLILKDGSVFTGAVNPNGQEGSVYLELDESSKWVLTEDSYITSLTCAAGAVDLNGHTLYVNGIAYDGSASKGEAVEMTVSASDEGMPEMGGMKPEGEMTGEVPPKPEGEMSGEAPAKPEGENGERPARPDGKPGEKPSSGSGKKQ